MQHEALLVRAARVVALGNILVIGASALAVVLGSACSGGSTTSATDTDGGADGGAGAAVPEGGPVDGAAADGDACAGDSASDPRCGPPVARSYFAICTLASLEPRLRYAVALDFAPRSGGKASFSPLSVTARKLVSAEALMKQPAIELGLGDDGYGAGASTVAFDLPALAFDTSSSRPSVRVTRFAVAKLRVLADRACSTIEMTTSTTPGGEGACVYLPLAEGSAVPDLSGAEISRCLE